MSNPHMKQMWRCHNCGFTWAHDRKKHTYGECRCGTQVNARDDLIWVAKENDNAQMHHRSGQITSFDPLVSFLYELLRDHVSPGVVEQILRQSPPKKTWFTNGWLALYAEDVAKRLRSGEQSEQR